MSPGSPAEISIVKPGRPGTRRRTWFAIASIKESPAEHDVAMQDVVIWGQRLLHIGDPDGDVVRVSVGQLGSAGVAGGDQPHQRAGIHLAGLWQLGSLGLVAKPAECRDGVPAAPTAASAERASDLDESVAQLAPCSGDSPVKMAVEIESPAQHLACIDHRKLRCSSTLAEPAIPDEQRARVMIETHRQIEFASEFVGERITIE